MKAKQHPPKRPPKLDEIELRYHNRPPELKQDAEALIIAHAGITIEIRPTFNGIQLRLDEPLSGSFAIEPVASNLVRVIGRIGGKRRG